MLSWASSQFERLSQTVAPPPEDPAGQFAYRCLRGEEDGAMELVTQLPYGAETVVVPAKERSPLHLSCLYSMLKLTRLLLTQPGTSVTRVDSEGNTALHCAAMGTLPGALEVVKLLVQEMAADVSLKNSAGQTPYNAAPLNAVRQYLLPLQLQKETKEALANGGQGLIPGMDMGGLRITGGGPPPPPTMGMVRGASGGPPPSVSGGMPPLPVSGGMPPPPMSGGMPPPPMSGGGAAPPDSSGGDHTYARSGSSSAAIYKPRNGKAYYQPDGFHSSSSDKRLQQKYGHSANTAGSAFATPPPPKSGESWAPPSSTGSIGMIGSTSSIGTNSVASSSNNNPYAGGYSAFRGASSRGSRYVSYDPVTGQQIPTTSAPPRSANAGMYQQQQPVPNLAIFTPGGAAAGAPPAQSQMTAIHSAPASAPVEVPQQQPPMHSYSSPAPAPYQQEHQQEQYQAQDPSQYPAPQQFSGMMGSEQECPQPPVPLQIVTPAMNEGAAGTSTSGFPAPPISNFQQQQTGLAFTTTPMAAGPAPADFFATPQPTTPSAVTKTTESAAATTTSQDSSFPSPPVSGTTPMKSAFMVSVSSPEAAAAAFASPVSASASSGNAQEAFSAALPTISLEASPPSQAATSNPEQASSFPAPEGGADPSEATFTDISLTDVPLSDVPLTDVPSNDPPPKGAETAPPAEPTASATSFAGLPPPPIGFMSTTSSSPAAAADLFSTPPPTS